MVYNKYNQIEYAKFIHENGLQNNKLSLELGLLCQYYKQVLGIKTKQRLLMLEGFCKENIKDYSKEKYWQTIKNAINYSSKKQNRLISIPYIKIFQDEFVYLNSFDISYDNKKILFAFLVYKKIAREIQKIKNIDLQNSVHFKGNKYRYNKIKQMANISNKIRLHEELIPELSAKDLIFCGTGGVLKLNFLENCHETGGALNPYVKNFEKVGHYVDYYNKKPGVLICELCSTPFKRKGNRQKYCSNECSKKMNICKNKERKEKSSFA